LDNLGNLLKNNQFLKSGLNAIPWLKSAVSLVDIFIGGGKTTTGPQEVKLLPLAVNLSVKLNGTISTANPYHNIIFTNPGSKDAQFDPDAYPYYNEVLGVFNLIKTPVVFTHDFRADCCDIRRNYGTRPSYSFRFDADSFYYALNQASDLSIQNMQGALIIKVNYGGYVDTSNMKNARLNSYFPNFEGKDAINKKYSFRTDYFDMKCLDRKIFKYAYTLGTRCYNCATPDADTYYGWSPNDTLYLKLLINLKRNNTNATTQNVLLVLTYPVKLMDDAVQVLTPTFATCDSTILDPASASFVNTFCSSTTYYNLNRQSRLYRDSIALERKIEKDGIGLYPNPNSGVFTIKIKKQSTTLSTFYITDMLGKRVYSSNEDNISLSNGLIKQVTVNLEHGTYILTAITSKGHLKTKFIVIH
jgi:hypothetical protein